MWEKIKANWKAILEVLGGLVGLLLFRQWNQKDLKAQLDTAETEKKDAVINEQKKENESQQADVEKSNEALKGDLNKPAPDATPNEVTDFWNKKK